ncbi:hypothetical protein D3C87_1417590 [compost metagenome]
MGANSPPCRNAGERIANNRKAPPIRTARMVRMTSPRVGSLAKVWTDVRMPERTRNVPSRDSEKVMMDRKIVQILRALRFSITSAECSSAVPASQGMKLAFSTGSQNHQPPQPSS